MVRKIFGFFDGSLDRKINSLNQAALLLGSFAFLSQFLAFLRDRLLAHIFGVGPELDIYYAAFRIPDFIFVTVASVVSLSVLVPFIIEKAAIDKGEEDRRTLRTFIDAIFSFFTLLILTVSVVTYFFLPALSEMLFKGLAPEAMEQVVFLSRILLLSPVVLGFSNLFGSITQAYQRFTLYALAPLLYNAGIIIGIISLTEKLGIVGVAVGVAVGALLHVLVQLPFIFKEGLLPRFRSSFDWQIISKVVAISIPRTLTLSMSSLVLIFLVAFASRMETGSITILSFSINLQSLPLSLIGVSYSLAAFPTLSRYFQEKNLKAFLEQMQTSTRFIIFWSLPLTALLIILRAQVVRVLLGTGLFDWEATRLTAAAVALFVVSSMFQSLLLLFMRGFYSAGATMKPFVINLIASIFLIVSTYAFVEVFYSAESFRYFVSALLKVEDVPGSVVLMLPLGFSIGIIANVIMLWIAFEREFKGFSQGVMRTLFVSVSASVIMGGVAYVGLNLMSRLIVTDTLVGVFSQGFIAGVGALVAGVLVLILLRSRELEEIWRSIRGRFWKANVIATDPEIV